MDGLNPAEGGWSLILKDSVKNAAEIDGEMYGVTIEFIDTVGGQPKVVTYDSGIDTIPIYDDRINEFRVPIGLRVSCHNTCDAVAMASFSGGTPPAVTYAWRDSLWNDPGFGNVDQVSLCGGTWHVIVTDAMGCVDTASVFVESPPSIIIDTAYVDSIPLCGGDSTGIIKVQASGGSGGFNYRLLPLGIVNASGTFEDVPAGDYIIKITDVMGCTEYTDTLIITEPDPLLISVLSYDNPTCSGFNDGEIQLDASDGTGSYMFVLQDMFSDIDTNLTGLFSDLQEGNYLGRVIDDNGCVTYSDTISLQDPEPPLITQIDSVEECTGLRTVTITATDGVAPLEYSITGRDSAGYQSSNVFEDVAHGDYFVSVRDVNACLASNDSLHISFDSLPLFGIQSATLLDSMILCAGDTGAVIITQVQGGQLPYSFELEDINSGILSPASDTAEGLGAGMYRIKVTDMSGCSDVSDTILIDEPLPVDVDSLWHSDLLCFGDVNGTIGVRGTGGTPGYTYYLSDLNVPVDTSLTGDFIGLDAGLYMVRIEDSNGCGINTDTVELIEPDPILITNVDTTLECSGHRTVTINATGGTGGLMYSILGQDSASYQSDSVFVNVLQGTYHVSVRDTNSCYAANDSVFNFVFDSVPLFSVTAEVHDSMILCHGEGGASIHVQVAGGVPMFHYRIENTTKGVEWNQPNDPDFSGLSAGDYSIYVTDGEGCTSTYFTEIEEPPAIIIDSIVLTDSNTTIFAHGGIGDLRYAIDTILYDGSGSSPPDSIFDSSYVFTGDTLNVLYYAYVMDSNGCYVSEEINRNRLNVELSIFYVVDCPGCSPEYLLGKPGEKGIIGDTVLCYGDMASVRFDFPDYFEKDTLLYIAYNDVQLDTTNYGDRFRLINKFASLPLPSGEQHSLYVENMVTGETWDTLFTIYSPDTIFVPNNIERANCKYILDDFDDVGMIAVYDINGGVPPYGLKWSNNDSATDVIRDTIFNLSTGMYGLTLTDKNECTHETTFNVNFRRDYDSLIWIGTASKIIDSVDLCEGDQVTIYAEVPDTLDLTIEWAQMIDSNHYKQHDKVLSHDTLFTLDPFVSGYPTDQTDFILLTYDSNYCASMDTITVYRNPVISVQDQTVDQITLVSKNKRPIQVSLNNLGTVADVHIENKPSETDLLYEWTTEGAGSNYIAITDQHKKKPDFNPGVMAQGDSVMLTLVVENGYNRYPMYMDWFGMDVYDKYCSDTASISMKMWNGDIPSGFTPNGDGFNDTWMFDLGTDQYINVLVQIFNRWGQLIYESQNYQGDWDGTRKGKDLPIGTYYYVITVLDNMGESLSFSGPLTIVR